METLNWDAINLDEWLAILQITGRIPDAASVAAKYSLDTLTRNPWADGYVAPSAVDRTQERMDRADPENTREEVRQDLWGN